MRYEVHLTRDIQQNLLISPQALLKEVVVYSRRRDENVKNAQMGRFDLAVSQIKSVPVIFGEVDILKTLQLLPGIRNAGEGNTGLYVRGGGPDQNLILTVDGQEVRGLGSGESVRVERGDHDAVAGRAHTGYTPTEPDRRPGPHGAPQTMGEERARVRRTGCPRRPVGVSRREVRCRVRRILHDRERHDGQRFVDLKQIDLVE